MEEGIDPEFLAALPPELQAEVMEQQVRGGGGRVAWRLGRRGSGQRSPEGWWGW